MSLLNKIIGKVNIINLHYLTGVDYDMTVGCYAITSEGFDKVKDLADKNAPDIVVITGAGVISKNKDEVTEGLSKRLDKDSFLSMIDKDGTMSFVRKLQLANMPYQPIIAIPAAQFNIDSLFELWNSEVSFKVILKFTYSGNIISRAILAKVKMPILLLFLSALIGNYYLTNKTRDRYASNQVLVSSLKQKNLPFTQNQNIDFSSKKINFAYLADRIGASTPATITLTALSIQPVTKKIETQKEIQLDKSLVVIAGSAVNTESITEFTNNLNSHRIAKELILSSIERNQDKNVINFKITLRL